MTVPRLLVVGSNGLLGQKVVELFVRGSSADITAASVEPVPVRNLHSVAYRQLDITVKKDVRALVASVEPTVIINCAAMTNVDGLRRSGRLLEDQRLGGGAPADAAQKSAALVHISMTIDPLHGPTEDDWPGR
jgi:dTDP-4-dehydrorhamnose reductase